jgi:hypothetical protein
VSSHTFVGVECKRLTEGWTVRKELLIGHPAPPHGEFELVIMVEVAIEEMDGADRSPPERLPASLGDGFDVFFNQSEMALFSEPAPCVSPLCLTGSTLSEMA